MNAAMNTASQNVPSIRLSALDHLWFQVSGTVCNLTCHHCFISCSPRNHTFEFLSVNEVREHLLASLRWGVKEYYFTGGEPFLNPGLVPMLEETLRYGPATVLTNATVLKQEWLERLRAAQDSSRYSLEFRVSIDGFSAETNDPIRGEGTFDRALEGFATLVEFGFLPIITAARTWPIEEDAVVLDAFARQLREIGCDRPRLKILPTLQLGAEEHRTRGYEPLERVTHEMLVEYDVSQLICDHSRIVTNRGVHVCPILIEAPDSLMGETLDEARGDFPLAHGPCFTCYQFGAICSNPSSGHPHSAPPTRGS